MGKLNVKHKDYDNVRGIRSTTAKTIVKRSLFHALSEERKEMSEAMKLGALLHTLVFDYDAVNDEFAVELKREDFPTALESMEEIKQRIADLIGPQIESIQKDSRMLNKSILAKQAQRTSQIKELDEKYENQLNNLDPNKFADRKGYNARKKEIRAKKSFEKKKLQLKFKAEIDAFKEQVKKNTAQIKKLNSKKIGKKQKVMENLRTLDPTVIYWCELKLTYSRDQQSKIIVSSKMMEQAEKMRNSVVRHPVVIDMIACCESEGTYTSDCPITGLPRKAKPDMVVDGRTLRYEGLRGKTFLADFKTACDVSPERFWKSVWNFHYDLQGAYHTDVYNDAMPEKPADPKIYVIIAVEKEPPYATAVYTLGERELNLGRNSDRRGWIRALSDYRNYLIEKHEKHSLVNSNQISYGMEPMTLSFPDWAYKDEPR